MLLLPGKALDYLLEERQLVCGQRRMQPLSTFACPWILHSMARQQRFFPVFLVLALLVVKLLEEEVLLGWGKVCRGSSCPTRLVPVDCSTQREASCCLHLRLGH